MWLAKTDRWLDGKSGRTFTCGSALSLPLLDGFAFLCLAIGGILPFARSRIIASLVKLILGQLTGLLNDFPRTYRESRLSLVDMGIIRGFSGTRRGSLVSLTGPATTR